MRLLFSLPEGVAEQGLRPKPRIHASRTVKFCMLARWSVEPRRWRGRSSLGGRSLNVRGARIVLGVMEILTLPSWD